MNCIWLWGGPPTSLLAGGVGSVICQGFGGFPVRWAWSPPCRGWLQGYRPGKLPGDQLRKEADIYQNTTNKHRKLPGWGTRARFFIIELCALSNNTTWWKLLDSSLTVQGCWMAFLHPKVWSWDYPSSLPHHINSLHTSPDQWTWSLFL